MGRRIRSLDRRARAVASSADAGHEIEAEVGTIAIDLMNWWHNAARCYILSCAVGARSASGSMIRSALGLASEDEYLAAAITAKGRGPRGAIRRTEPDWKNPAVMIDLAKELKLTNEPDVARAFSFGFSSFGDLPVFRNYFAHRNRATRTRAMQLAPQYGTSAYAKPSDVLRSAPWGAASSVLEQWIAEIQLTLEFLCQ